MITDEILLNNGYEKYGDNIYNSDCLFQKKVKDSTGKVKYFIDIYKYDYKWLDNVKYEARLVAQKDKYTLNILFYCLDENVTLDYLEQEIDYTWVDLGCNYYGDDE